MDQQDQILTLQLSTSWVNTILVALEELPHKISRPIIDSLVTQGHQQLQQSIESESAQNS